MLPDLRYIIVFSVILFVSILFFTFKIYLFFTRKIERQQRENMQSVLETQENERQSIAREVHDNLGPLLSITNMQVESVIAGTAGDVALLEEIQKQLGYAILICRDISHALTPLLYEQSDLYDMVNEHVEKINRTGKLAIRFEYGLQHVNIHNQKAASICRIVLELMNNTLKHANASVAELQMTEKDKQLLLVYSDDGRGMGETDARHGIGQRNIATRVHLLNGQLQPEQPKNRRGFSIRIKIPISELL